MPDTALPVLTGTAALRESAFSTTPLCFPGIFTSRECDDILAIAEPRLKYRSGLSVPREGVRTALTAWLDPGPETQAVTDRLSRLVHQVNAYYDFDIVGFRDPLLISRYLPEDHFDWHFDVADPATSTRKLSLSVQLSEPSEYDGGALEFSPRGELPFARARGSVIVFPSYLCHRVSPVTRGARAALICWAHGPAFR
ncbi:MAG TPA: 2OG-Fe(II) oxygenase [Usitatibacter sp.]|nr:2OG-Fe(II) oxygenase [Usitatibacter sp.]